MPRKKRRPSPAFPMYPKDFLGDANTITMSAEEIGAYVLLLLHAWEQGANLPNDMTELAALARVEPTRFADMWDRKLSRCFIVSRSKATVSNPRQEREAVKQRKYSAEQSIKASERWRKERAAAEARDKLGSAGALPPTPPSPPPPPPSLTPLQVADPKVSLPGVCALGICGGDGTIRASRGRIMRTCDCPTGKDRARRVAENTADEKRAAENAPPKRTRARREGERPNPTKVQP